MNKYKIKNCPAISFAGGCQNGKVKVWDCQDCTDCLLKEIVELCKETLNSLETYVDVRSFECVMLQNILKLLDIQEVE